MTIKKTISDLNEVTTATDDMVLLVEDSTSTNKITKANLMKDVIPEYTVNDANKVLTVNNSGTGTEWVANAGGYVITNPYKGMEWNCLGDSITQMSSVKRYFEFVNESLEFGSINMYGVSGTTIAKKSSSDDTAMCVRISSMSKTANVISIEGGVNDCGNNIPLGNMESTDLTTFYGALKSMCEYLLTNYSGKVIFFMTPTKYTSFFQDPNTLGLNLVDYVNAMLDVCG